MASTFVVAIVGAVGVAVAYLLYQWWTQDPRPLPPGPKGLPLVGNLNDLPKPGELEHEFWLKHKEVYGPLSSITVLGSTFVIVNDANIALELLRDRAVNYSSRPTMTFAGELAGYDNTLAFSEYTTTFKLHRKNLAKVMGASNSLRVFNRVQEAESVHFLLRLLEDPKRFLEHIKTEAGAVILKTTYGYNIEPHGKDVLVEQAGQVMANFGEAAVPGRFLVDVMPALKYLPKWLPGSGFLRLADDMNNLLHDATERPYQLVKRRMQEGKQPTSFLSEALKDTGNSSHLENIYKWSASSMYFGGADTTVSSLMTFFLAMVVFPDVQRKAQEELDRVIGGERLPVTTDLEKLPYIEAVLKETHRWWPVAPMGLPHRSTEDDEILGYRLPKGTTFLPNNWWFTHDPSVYPKPMEFIPERFLATKTHAAETDPRTWTFGYGRRVCPGRYVADNALFITIAQTLATFNISKAVENGKVVEPEVKFESGVVSHPKPFKASIVPRSEKHAALVRRMEQEYPWEKSDAEALKSL